MMPGGTLTSLASPIKDVKKFECNQIQREKKNAFLEMQYAKNCKLNPLLIFYLD